MIKVSAISIRWVAFAALMFAWQSVHGQIENGTNVDITIISLPEDQTVPTNGAAVFTVVAENSTNAAQPLLYQWFKNGTTIAGATNASFVIPDAHFSDVAFYFCYLRILPGDLPFEAPGRDCSVPGTRLSVYEGTNAPSGPSSASESPPLAPPVEPITITTTDNAFSTNTITSLGSYGNVHTLLSWGSAVTNSPKTPLISRAVGRTSSTTFTFVPTDTNIFYEVALLTNFSGTNLNIKIVSLPGDDIVPTNGSTTFTVVAENATNPEQALLYQWYQNDFPLTNQTDKSLLITNAQISDVGFYSCDLRTSTNDLPLRVGGKDCDAPGVRLFVYTGTNTAVSGPYQPKPSGVTGPNCIGSYIGSVIFMNELTKRYSFPQPTGAFQGVLRDTTTGIPNYASRLYYYEGLFGKSDCFTQSPTAPASPGSSWTFNTQTLTQPPADLYQFSIYVITGSLTLGRPITLDIGWHRSE